MKALCNSKKRSKNCLTRKWKFYNVFQKTRVWVMEVFVLGIHIVKKASTFVWIYIMSVRWRRDSAILKNARKICFTRKLKFYNVFQKTRIWVKTEFVPVLYIERGKTFCFELYCIHKVETWKRFAMLKKAQKVLLPAKENFTTIFKKHVHESWRSLLQFFILKKGNYFDLDLHHVHNMEMGQRHTFKNA